MDLCSTITPLLTSCCQCSQYFSRDVLSLSSAITSLLIYHYWTFVCLNRKMDVIALPSVQSGSNDKTSLVVARVPTSVGDALKTSPLVKWRHDITRGCATRDVIASISLVVICFQYTPPELALLPPLGMYYHYTPPEPKVIPYYQGVPSEKSCRV